MRISRRREPEGFPRLVMVLAGMAPLFILWAIRGVQSIPDSYLIPACLALALLPNLYLWLRIDMSRRKGLKTVLAISRADDHRQHLLAYLFAMLLPLYDANLGDWRALGAVIVAFLFVLFLFWHLNLHYMNVFLAIAGYRVYTIQPPAGSGDGRIVPEPFVLITRRPFVNDGDEISALYISRTLYFEPKPENINVDRSRFHQ